MRKSDYDQSEIKEELSKFINLLQSDFTSLQIQPQSQNCFQHPLAKKLSIILSASEPESSSLDKENSNPSANRSFESNEKSSEPTTGRKDLLETLMASTLTSSQLKLAQKIRQELELLRAQNQRQNRQIQQLKKELQSQKKANDELLNVLMQLDKQQKQLWENYNTLTAKYTASFQKSKQVENQLETAQKTILSLQNDNDFMKKLIFYANQNYEALERKCYNLEMACEKSRETTGKRSLKTSSTDKLLKSAKTKKYGYSPNRSELLRTPSPQNFQQIYQKMIIRTLKSKGRSPLHYPY